MLIGNCEELVGGKLSKGALYCVVWNGTELVFVVVVAGGTDDAAAHAFKGAPATHAICLYN